MRIALFIICTIFLGNILFAQSADSNFDKGKFKKENLFIGTGINLGIAGKSFNVGINPEIGYSLTKWMDAGIAFNLNYFSQNPNDFSNIKYQNLSYGAGSFIRIWPVNFFHIQIQPEFNWINSTQKNMSTSTTLKYNYNAGSLLVGIGYGSHFIGNRYSYVTLMMDILQNKNSPYRDQFNDPIPVFKAGFGMYLKPSRK
ncbi:MAG: hypothetical protein WCJ80_08760 [Bacteroidota bacterium]|jgi:hypothetical protein